MLDSTLRPVKDRLLAPVATGAPVWIHPIAVSAIGLAASLGAAVAAWRGAIVASVGLWLLGRLLDGVDGAIARASGRQSDLGGLLDFLFDTVGYAAVPIGIAAGGD
ncbi:MAG: CDP-alcohol phosphatidyltransferase family protein, partial [Actinomycetota bacterium]